MSAQTKASTHEQAASTIHDFCRAMDDIAPLRLAQDWDNVGLLVGDHNAPLRAAMLCIDLTPPVVDEAIANQVDCVMAYHPPIFKPIPRITVPARGTEAAVFRCLQSGVAVYSTHTAMDAAEGGTNDVIASHCGITQNEPLEYVDDTTRDACKLVVFVPAAEADALADVMFAAGAGHIGDYSKCSYRLAGEGTFFGGEGTAPTIGQAGRFERAAETRLETIVPTSKLPQVLQAMTAAHSYEEPAYDVYPLKPKPVRGIGRVGSLPQPLPLRKLAAQLKDDLPAPAAQIVGEPNRDVSRAIIVVGAAGGLPFRIPLNPSDVIITGEIRHHDALTIRRHGATAIALNHWASERPAMKQLQQVLTKRLPNVRVALSEADADPLMPVPA